jgi:serine/threonine-protein kinase HipA
MPTSNTSPRIFTELPVATYQRLPALLSDALPDDFGNALVNRWMADHGVPADRITPLDRLAYMGSRAMGALQFRPARGPRTPPATAVELSELVTTARGLARGTMSDDSQAHSALRHLIDVGTSAGGARAKAVIAWNRTTGEIRTGQLDAPPEFEHWLLKFDGMGPDHELGTSQDFGRIEYAYHLMARAAGVQMTDCDLLQENGRAHFVTRRFDREADNTRHHVQTLCAMTHLDYKLRGSNSYASLFETISRLRLPFSALEEAYRRMAFNVMARNCDDHSKNFAFLLRQGGQWELAPAYDLTFAHNPAGYWTHQHLMSVNGRFKDIDVADLLAVADRFAIGSAAEILRGVADAVARWESFAKAAGLPPSIIARIQEHHELKRLS